MSASTPHPLTLGVVLIAFAAAVQAQDVRTPRQVAEELAKVYGHKLDQVEPAKMQSRSSARGFTMLELMVAVTLAGMLLLAGLPSFTTFLRNAEVRSTAESISNGLRLARTEATRLNRPVSFTLAGGGSTSWTINIFNPVTGALLQPPIDQYSKFEVGRSAMAASTPANAVAVTFNGLGRIVSPSPIATPNLQQIEVRPIVGGEARTLRIYADDLHGIRMCDPDPAIKALLPPDARAC